MDSDMRRILDLPVDERDGSELVDKWTERFRRPGGEWRFHPHQALAFEYLENGDDGAIFQIDVGGGKTLIAMFAAAAAGVPVEDTLVLAPAHLRDEADREWARYNEHFHTPRPEYRSYAWVSTSPGGLREMAPKLIIADECQMLKNLSSARGNRFFSYMRSEWDTVRFVGMTATFSNKSLGEWRHLGLVALRKRAPLPDTRTLFRSMCRVTDVSSQTPPSSHDFARCAPLAVDGDEDLVTRIRIGFRERVRTAPGVVSAGGSSCDKPITIKRLECETPGSVQAALDRASNEWLLPGDEEIRDPLRYLEKTRQLTQGFYYRFIWPNGEPNIEWLEDRRVFYGRVRRYAKRAAPGRDTFGLVVEALEDGEIHFPEWDMWQKWRDYDPPPREAVWLDDYLLEDAVSRATPGTLIWYEHNAVGERLSEMIPTAMAGEDVPDADVVGVSISSHGTGLNLQYDFHRNIVLYPRSSGGIWHQFLGRTHRNGQTSDQVEVEWYGHHWSLVKGMQNARESAVRQRDMDGIEHKLLLAEESK